MIVEGNEIYIGAYGGCYNHGRVVVFHLAGSEA